MQHKFLNVRSNFIHQNWILAPTFWATQIPLGGKKERLPAPGIFPVPAQIFSGLKLQPAEKIRNIAHFKEPVKHSVPIFKGNLVWLLLEVSSWKELTATAVFSRKELRIFSTCPFFGFDLSFPMSMFRPWALTWLGPSNSRPTETQTSSKMVSFHRPTTAATQKRNLHLPIWMKIDTKTTQAPATKIARHKISL